MRDLEQELRAALLARSNQIESHALREPTVGQTQRRGYFLPALTVVGVIALFLLLAATGVFDHAAHRTQGQRSGSSVTVGSWPRYTAPRGKLSVRYDPNWRAYPSDYASSFSAGLVIFSSQLVPPTCASTAHGAEIDCDPIPPMHLAPGGVRIAWSSSGTLQHATSASALIADDPGYLTTIDGLPAKLAKTRPGESCADTGATLQIEITIATGRSTTTHMSACLRTNGRDRLQQRVIASAYTARV